MASLPPPRTATRRDVVRALAAAAAACAGLPLLAACDVREFAYRHGARRRLSIATAGTGGVFYVYGGAIARVVSAHVPKTEATAELTAGTVDNAKLLARGAVDLAFLNGDVLDDAMRRRDAFARGPAVPARTIATLYTNLVHLVTFADLGVARVADLRGRSVSTGAPGAGTETSALRILAAAGLDPDRDVQRQRLSFAASAEAMKDGKLDACFISSGVPNPSVMDLAATRGRPLRIVPLDDVRPALQRDFGAEVYGAPVIPGGAYAGVAEDVPSVGIANLLVADERLGEALAYEITRALFVHRAELEAVTRVARELDPRAAVARSPAPFHPGAIRYYREVGAWTA